MSLGFFKSYNLKKRAVIEELHSEGSFLLLWGTRVQSGRVHFAGVFSIMNLSVRKIDKNHLSEKNCIEQTIPSLRSTPNRTCVFWCILQETLEETLSADFVIQQFLKQSHKQIHVNDGSEIWKWKVFLGKSCQCKIIPVLWSARQQFWSHSFSIYNSFPCVKVHTQLIKGSTNQVPFYCCYFLEEQVSSFQNNFKAGLTEIYGHIWWCFTGWWLILQSRRWMESLRTKVLESCAGGQRKALAGFCHWFLINAAVRRAGRPEWGRCGGGVALTQQSIQEVIIGTSLKAQGLWSTDIRAR